MTLNFFPLGKSTRDGNRGMNDPGEMNPEKTFRNKFSNFSPFHAISLSINGKNCGSNEGKAFKIFVLFELRNARNASATTGSANSRLKHKRKNVLRLGSASCKTISPKSRKNCRIASNRRPLEV